MSESVQCRCRWHETERGLCMSLHPCVLTSSRPVDVKRAFGTVPGAPEEVLDLPSRGQRCRARAKRTATRSSSPKIGDHTIRVEEGSVGTRDSSCRQDLVSAGGSSFCVSAVSASSKHDRQRCSLDRRFPDGRGNMQ